MTRLNCPIYCYWGGNDEVIDELVGLDALHRETAAYGFPFEVVPGMNHEGLLHHIDIAMPVVRDWLLDTLRAQHG
ncbi:hypothetical protein [Leekyejoonella antrihumi]|uniref:Alpha/beta hydrolase n=1 Tax=Leekyejoonella antrihumi TaxID=1660198 RepID=A0A563DQK4_9MICO|nr:hypothetical protein [Leekyejoonella antrihumi]TWP31984.1 hypothetical protein FGL98_24895 [Leekyejoonella antrihumi]